MLLDPVDIPSAEWLHWLYRDLKPQVENLPEVWQTGETLLENKRRTWFPVHKQPQEPRLPRRGFSTRLWGWEHEEMGVPAWELLLDAATLQNIMHTFQRRSWLGNTDTVGVLGSRTVEKEQHSAVVTPWLCWVGLDMWWSCESVCGRLRSGKDVVPSTQMTRRPDHEARHGYEFGSRVQWFMLCCVYCT